MTLNGVTTNDRRRALSLAEFVRVSSFCRKTCVRYTKLVFYIICPSLYSATMTGWHGWQSTVQLISPSTWYFFVQGLLRYGTVFQILLLNVDTVNMFKAHLDKFWQHQQVVFDFKGEIAGVLETDLSLFLMYSVCRCGHRGAEAPASVVHLMSYDWLLLWLISNSDMMQRICLLILSLHVNKAFYEICIRIVPKVIVLLRFYNGKCIS